MSKNEKNQPGAGTEAVPNQTKLIIQRFWQLKPEHMETVEGKSETVPDDTMSIKQIVERYTRGQRIPDNLMRSTINDPQADFDSHDLEEVNRMDITDRHILKTDIEKDIEQKKLFLQEEKRKKQEAERDRLRSREASGEASSRQSRKPDSDEREGGTTTSKERAGFQQKRKDEPENDD